MNCKINEATGMKIKKAEHVYVGIAYITSNYNKYESPCYHYKDKMNVTMSILYYIELQQT